VSTYFCAHSGRSMNPTLHETDLLELLPAREAGVAVGDIILFRPRGWKENVIHRVTAIAEGTVHTRGDNSAEDDPWSLTQGQIAGVVVAAWRGRRRRTVLGGRPGLLLARAVRARRATVRRTVSFLRPLYRSLARIDFSIVLPVSLQPRVVTCGTPRQRVRRILMGNRIVGRFDEARGEWRVRKPYGLFVSPTNIP
jgi:hypothetical protein